MSDLSTQGVRRQGAAPRVANQERTADQQRSTETKSAYQTTEFIVYLVAAAALLIAGYVVDGFTATETWRFFTFLTIGYLISRGLAKSGSREPYRD